MTQQFTPLLLRVVFSMQHNSYSPTETQTQNHLELGKNIKGKNNPVKLINHYGLD